MNLQSQWELFPIDQNPTFCSYSPDLEYGRIHIDNTSYDIVVGPAFNVPVTEQLVRQYMRELMVPLDYREQLLEYLSSIPRISHRQFASYLAFLYQCVNDKEANLEDFYGEDEVYTQNRTMRLLDSMVEDMENDNISAIMRLRNRTSVLASNGASS